jgi:hypothetical protein
MVDIMTALATGGQAISRARCLEARALSFSVATRWRHGRKQESRPFGRLSENLLKSEVCLVAGIGFEPMTFRL